MFLPESTIDSVPQYANVSASANDSAIVSSCKSSFPLLVSQPKLVYFDSAATTQKPQEVIDALQDFYETANANPHRGVYALSVSATNAYAAARETVAEFLGARNEEIVFVRNATEGINLVMHSWAQQHVKQGDTILLTEMEHHSNLVPWQVVAKEKGARLDFIPLTPEGLLDMNVARSLLMKKPVLLALTHVSNVLGSINPVKQLVQLAHTVGAKVLLDACQSVAHMPVNVQEFGVDFMVFSGHKIYGPTGSGVVYIKKELHAELVPFLFGGDMIQEVHWHDSSFAAMPYLLEAGTPPVAEAVGLARAIDFVRALGWDWIQTHEQELMITCLNGLRAMPQVKILGTTTPAMRSGLIAFNLGDMHAHDVASVLDDAGVCIRSGHHCCMPLHEKLGIAASCRVSFGVYNSREDIVAFLNALTKACEVFKLEQ